MFAYGVATMSRLLKITGVFCKRALYKRLYSANETYHFKEPTNCSHPIMQARLHKTVVHHVFAFSCPSIGAPLALTYMLTLHRGHSRADSLDSELYSFPCSFYVKMALRCLWQDGTTQSPNRHTHKHTHRHTHRHTHTQTHANAYALARACPTPTRTPHR